MKKYQIIAVIVTVVAVLTGAVSYGAIKGKSKSGKEKVKQEKTATEGAVTTEGALTAAAVETFPIGEKLSYIKKQAEIKADITTEAAVTAKLSRKDVIKIEEEKKDSNGTSWSRISYKSGEKVINGWTLSENVAKEYKELLKEKYSALDYEAYPKVKEYPGNPRIKAKGIYLTLYSASGEKLNKLIAMTKRTKINTFVIDVKDDNGNMLFKTAAAEKFVPAANINAPIKDIAAFIKKLKDNNIYVIARIVCFKDPNYAKAYPDRVITYKDSGKPFVNADKLTWVTAYDRNLWSTMYL